MAFKGHFTGAFGKTKGQGQAIDFIATDLLKIIDGRITDNWHIEDNLTLLTQMGVYANDRHGVFVGDHAVAGGRRDSRAHPRSREPIDHLERCRRGTWASVCFRAALGGLARASSGAARQ